MLHRFFRFVTQSLLTFLCILLLGGLLAGGWFFYQGRQLYRSAASSYPVTSMYDTIRARGSYTSYDALPQTYINAVICTEDEHFMTHKGIDPGAIARALLADLRTRSLAEGGSTLTQQLAKNELFTQDKHLARKAAEMLAAFDLERPTPSSRSLRCTPTPSISETAATASRRLPRGTLARNPPS